MNAPQLKKEKLTKSLRPAAKAQKTAKARHSPAAKPEVKSNPEHTNQSQLVKDFAARSRECSLTMIEGIIAFGECLSDAKDKLTKKVWNKFTKDPTMCPVTRTVAVKYIQIAKHPDIRAKKNWKTLPIAYNVLYEISQMTAVQFDKAIKEEKITPKTTMNVIRRAMGKAPKPAPEIKKKEADPDAVNALADAMTNGAPVPEIAAPSYQLYVKLPHVPKDKLAALAIQVREYLTGC